MRKVFAALLSMAMIPCALAAAKSERPTDAAGWQKLAHAELDAAHAAIRDAHPGVIDRENPSFNTWVEDGYREALRSVPSAVDYESFISVVRIYTTGFRDGHLAYSDDIRAADDTISIDGWQVRLAGAKYVVSFTADDWPVPLPPRGAEWLDCDGETPTALMQTHVAPFINRQEGTSYDELRANQIWQRFLPGLELHRCKFRDGGGSTQELAVAYRALKTDAFFELANKAGSVQHNDCNRHNTMQRIGDVLWVHASNFSLQEACGDVRELDALLAALPKQTGVRTLVFDVRGNGGGDSSIGDRIFDAATGGLDFDHSDLEKLPRTFAQWRVSDVLIATAKRTAERKSSLYGADSAQARDAEEFLASVEHAKANGETWVEQRGGRRITAADVAARHGKLKRFDGKVAIVTDGTCVSACLDFVDDVKQVPHAIQLGRTTGSDSVYIDTGNVYLPSGNHVVLPLKVWRNRLRANNEPYVPDIPLDVDLRDDDAVRTATLSALGIRAAAPD
jgi:hypothetical protein